VSTSPEHKAGQQALVHFLQRQGRLSAEEVALVEKARGEGQTVHEALEHAGIMPEKELALFLATALNLRTIDLTTYPLDAEVAREIKEGIATRYAVLPVHVEDGSIDVATANPLDIDALKAVEFATGKRVQALVATETGVRDATAHAYNLQESLEQFLQHVPDNESLTVAELQGDEQGDLRTIAHDAELPPVVRLADLMLIEAIKTHSSDVHVEPATDTLLVRYRVDGILEEAFRFPKWVQNPLIARLKIMARLDITERRVPQDGRIRLRYQDKNVDLRVASLPSQHGEKITLRILDPATSLQKLDRIGLGTRHLALTREAIRRPQGMVLITGPTGSGKTTTLYAVLREIFSPNVSIVTIEDPIEYQLKGINQVEINDKQGRTFAGVLRSVLRQDPDIILVGEIRDRETAQIAFQAAQTGHLVLTTVHTNDAAGAVTRLVDLGLDARAVASTVNLVVAQRLVRRVCHGCAGPEALDAETCAALQLPPDFAGPRRGAGCPMCRGSGYAGRIGVYELVPVSSAIAKLLESGAGETAIRQQARTDGHSAMLEDALEKLAAGVTTAAEIRRVVQVKEAAPRCPGCHKEVAEDFSVCPHCSRVLHASCGGCGKPLGTDWAACPYCGTAVAAPADDAAAAASATAPRTFRALVVDDTEHIREIVKVALERSDLNLQVVTAANGEEALAAAARERPDVVVLDISMPDMDGFEVCRRLRSEVRTAFVPVLMLSAHSSEDFVARGFGVGADDYMVKPFRRDDLIARLRRMLERTYGSAVADDPGEAPLVESAAATAAPVDSTRLDALSAEVAGIAGMHGALLERIEGCERLLSELAAHPPDAAPGPRDDGIEAARASVEEIRSLVAEVRAEQATARAALAARLDEVEAKGVKGGRTTGESAEPLAELQQAVACIRSEQAELTTALAARAGSEEAQDEECGRRLAALTARLEIVEAEESAAVKAAAETAGRLAALQQGLADVRAEQAAGAEDRGEARARSRQEREEAVQPLREALARVTTQQSELAAALAARAESEQAQDEQCERRLAALAARLDELKAEGSAGGHAGAETAARLAGVQEALAELRATQAALAEDLRAAHARVEDFSARFAADDPEREHLKDLVDQGETRHAEVSGRLQRESWRLDMLLPLVDGCETQLTDFAGRLEKDLLRRDTLMALVDGCEAQLTELAARLTGRSVALAGTEPAPAGEPAVDLHERLKALNAMLTGRTVEGASRPDPGTVLRLRTGIFGQLRRQLEELRAGAPWPAAARKTLSLLIDSILAATIAPVVRGALRATGMGFLEAPAPDEPTQPADEARL
jgi:type IV pilus assembly protein PilB